VATPLLYVRGGVSPVAIDAYLDGLRRAGVQNVQGSVIPDAGHFLADEQPDALWTVLREFAER
jgi:pimeloyl-ACP methyl ester carboxylesterase